LLKNNREHRIINLVLFYFKRTYLKSKPESIVKELKGLRVLAKGLNIVYKWLLELNISRLDVFLNNKYNSKGASLVKAIIEAIDKTIKGEYIYY
jgi:hypothetical protein